jgi:hypothetical protein
VKARHVKIEAIPPHPQDSEITEVNADERKGLDDQRKAKKKVVVLSSGESVIMLELRIEDW